MGYEGLVGKIGKNIFEGSGRGSSGLATYSGVGAGVGAVSGGFLSDDNFGTGAFRGALFGAGVGGAINLLPKGINAAFKGTDWVSYNGNFKHLVGDTADSFRGTYDTVNKDSNKELMKEFGASARKHVFKKSGDFSYNTSKDVLTRVSSGSAEELETLNNLGRGVWKDTEGFLGKRQAEDALSFFRKNSSVWSGLDSMNKWKVGSSALGKAGFDSVLNHVMKPTGELLKGKVNFETATAGAVSAFGLYEGYNAINEVADGNYSGAFASLAGFAGLKLAYSQGMNIRAVDKILKEKDMTWGGVFKAGVSGYGAKKFVTGLSKMTEAQVGDLSTIGSAIGPKLSSMDSSPLVVGPNMKRQAKISGDQIKNRLNNSLSNTKLMGDRVSKNKYTVAQSQKELSHGFLLDSAGGSWKNNMIGSGVVFGAGGMLAGGISSDSSMLEGLAYGAGTGMLKGAGTKLAIDSYAKGAVKDGTALFEKGSYIVKANDDTSLLFNSKNFMNGLF